MSILPPIWPDARLKSRRPKVLEIDSSVIAQMANIWLLAEGQNVVSPTKEISSMPENVDFHSRNPSDRVPICGEIDTQKLLNVPLLAARGSNRLEILRMSGDA